MISDTEIAWLGGMLDGEGSVRIYRAGGGKTFWAQVQPVSNTDPDIVQRVANALFLLGVGFSLRLNNGNNKRAYSKPWWKVCSDIRISGYPEVAKYLRIVIPYATGGKRKQANAVLAFVDDRIKRGNPGKRRRPAHWQAEDEAHYRNQPVSRGRETPANTLKG